MLQIPRRNYATAIQRSNYKNRGSTYTDLGVAMRCSHHSGDQTSITNTVHYLTTGGATLKFLARKQEFLIPVILLLRALSGPIPPSSNGDDADYAAGGTTGMVITDEELYRRIVQGDSTNTFLVARAGLLLQDARARFGNLNTPEECLAFMGVRFRRLGQRSETTSSVDVGHYMIRNYILVHLPNYRDKLECLLFMLRKMYSFAAGDCGVDNADSLQNQEILLPGHLMSAFVKEKFEEFLQNLRTGLQVLLRKDYAHTCSKLQSTTFWSGQVDRFSLKSSGGIGKKVSHFLSTGNIVSTTGLDLMQVSGYTIVAERLNFLRYCAHFRSVHRGSFFMEMKTTAVRKLLPDQYGFLCPVHTPDGGPCGLLSHLALKCSIMSYPEDLSKDGICDLDELLISLGVAPVGAGGRSGDGRATSSYTQLPVCIDGRLVGIATANLCKQIGAHLRKLKVADPPAVPPTLEIALLPPGNPGTPYPGLYLFTISARMVRPVLQRATGKTEMIGPLEQAFMDIACLDEDIREGISTHQELDPMNMLSLIASLTPFSDQNQSPRNMYQCQMGKQTMGTPCHSLAYRSDNKLYKLQTPQAPIVQTAVHGKYKMDEYPNGTNAVVGT
jgi:DNA-directed RNA polymerase I subunit RPA2